MKRDQGEKGVSTNFAALPAPAYIPEYSPRDGWFEYLVTLDPNVPTFTIAQGPITTAVFSDEDGFEDGNIGGFAQAADDAREVIDFMHTWPVPGDNATAVPCVLLEGGAYDVSISDVSGLQVPKNIVDGSEGREFTVTVANAGPDAASGTVTVTAASAAGSIEGSPWTFDFTDLPVGASESFIQLFAIDLGERTTISWTATAFAPDDINLANNTVTATSNVKVTSGGGRP